MLIRAYSLIDNNCNVQIDEIYKGVRGYTTDVKKDKHKQTVFGYFTTIFDLLDINFYKFISLHLTVSLVRNLLNNRYDYKISDVEGLDGFLLKKNNTVILYKYVNDIVDEVERLHMLLTVTNFTSTKFDRKCTQTLVFKLIKTLEFEKNNNTVKITAAERISTHKQFSEYKKEKVVKHNFIKLIESEHKPPILEFNTLFNRQNTLGSGVNKIITSSFFLHTIKPITRHISRVDTVVFDGFTKTLDTISGADFYINHNLLNYTLNICHIETLHLKKCEGEILIKFKEVLADDIKKAINYKNVLSCESFPKNLEKNFNKLIDWFRKKNYKEDFLKKKQEDFKKKMLYINKETMINPGYKISVIEKLDKKIKTYTSLLESPNNEVQDFMKNIYKKQSNMQRLDLKIFQQEQINEKQSLPLQDSDDDLVGVDNEQFSGGLDGYESGCLDEQVGYYRDELCDKYTDKPNKGVYCEINTDVIKSTYRTDIKEATKEQIKIETKLMLIRDGYEKLKQDRKNKITEIQKHYSKVAEVNQFTDYCTFLNKYRITRINFFIYGCFRGRTYYDSIISPQSSLLYRFIYDFGLLDNKDNMPFLPQYITDDIISKLNKIGVSDLNLVYVILSIGVLFKKECTKDDGKIYFERLITLGIEKYNRYENKGCGVIYDRSLDKKTTLELNYYIGIILNSLGSNEKRRFYLIKDTTASFMQHIGALCGYKQDTLKYINLDNDYFMYDTYVVILNKLIKILIRKKAFKKAEADHILKFLTRDLLKATIMTIAYGIGIKKSKKNFETKLNNYPVGWFSTEHKDEIDIKKKLLEVFIIIFKILKSGRVELEFFEKSIKDVKKQLLGRAGLDQRYNDVGIDMGIKLTDLSMPIRYNVTVQDQIDVNIDTKTERGVVRFTLGNQKIKINKETNRPYVDSSKTDIAMFVNTVHLIDAYYLRKIVNTLDEEYGIKILCVHDGFGIDYTQIDKLMVVACQKIITNLDIGIVDTNNGKIVADGLSMVAVLI